MTNVITVSRCCFMHTRSQWGQGLYHFVNSILVLSVNGKENAYEVPLSKSDPVFEYILVFTCNTKQQIKCVLSAKVVLQSCEFRWPDHTRGMWLRIPYLQCLNGVSDEWYFSILRCLEKWLRNRRKKLANLSQFIITENSSSRSVLWKAFVPVSSESGYVLLESAPLRLA